MSFFKRIFGPAPKLADIHDWTEGVVTSVSYNKARKTYTFCVRVPEEVVLRCGTVYFTTKLSPPVL